jgi:asparagine synthase (glutamine-hydrolysing)
MCGLLGYFSQSKPINHTFITNGLTMLKHRGPDQMDYWMSHDSTVALGVTRLSINDLSKIDLPISNADGSIQVIANAEIYNFKELKHILKTKGYQFRTQCDIEVIPFLYEEYGINFINKLRGEFAFIIWDERQKSLFAVRDRFGIKPLYYVENDDAIYFCSEIPPLLKLKVTKNKWNYQAIYDYTHLSLPYTKTFFADIHQLPPANVLAIRQGKLAIESYWDLNYSRNENINYSQIIESIREKLIEATIIRTKADVPVACYLSGGIDSSALLGIAAKYSKTTVDAFTIAFDNERVNESDISRRTAQYAKAKLHTIFVSENNTIEYFASAVTSTCFPMPNTAGVARYLLSKFARDNGYKTVLSGEGADEVFLGYWGALIEASEDQRSNTNFILPDTVKNTLLKQLPVNRQLENYPDALKHFKSLLPHLPSWFVTQGYFNAKHRDLLNDSIKNDFTQYSPYVDLINAMHFQNKLEHFDNVQISSYTWIKSFFPNTMLNWIGDRAEMANSIESRQPFLDHELFELLARIPTSIKLKGGVEKHLLREAVKPFVTDEIYKRKKFMFQAPPVNLCPANKLYQLLKSYILNGAINIPFYDKDKLYTLLSTADKSEMLSFSDKAELGYTLTSVASMAILANHYQITV